MSKFIKVAAGALTIGVAIGGCVWVPLLISKVSRVTGERDDAQGRVSGLESDLQTEKATVNKTRLAAQFDVRQVEKQRDEYKQDLLNARDQLDKKKLELAASGSRLLALQKSIEKTSAGGGQDIAGAKSADPSPANAAGKSAANNTAKQNVAKSETVKAAKSNVAAAKPATSEAVVRFTDDTLYDDKGWTSSRK